MSFSIRIVQPSGLLSIAATKLFRTEIKNAIASDAAIVLVDFARIPSMNSANFFAVIKALKLVKTSGCQLFVCSLSEQIRMLFELTGLDQVITTFVDANEFAAYIEMQKSTIEVPRQLKGDVDALKLIA